MNMIKTRPFHTARAGFTLIEIMLVVVIIGMLLTVAVVKISGASKQAKLVATQHQMDAFKSALGLYEMDNGFYPTTEQGLDALIVKPASPPEPSHWKGPYLDPPVIRDDQWGSKFLYKCPGEKMPQGYDLSSPGPDKMAGTDDDIGNWM